MSRLAQFGPAVGVERDEQDTEKRSECRIDAAEAHERERQHQPHQYARYVDPETDAPERGAGFWR